MRVVGSTNDQATEKARNESKQSSSQQFYGLIAVLNPVAGTRVAAAASASSLLMVLGRQFCLVPLSAIVKAIGWTVKVT